MRLLRMLPGVVVAIIVAANVASMLYDPLHGRRHLGLVVLIALASGSVAFLLVGAAIEWLSRRRRQGL
jgi:hypothetical protein